MIHDCLGHCGHALNYTVMYDDDFLCLWLCLCSMCDLNTIVVLDMGDHVYDAINLTNAI